MKLRNFLFINRLHSKTTTKSILFSSIGLAIALLLIISSFYYLDTQSTYLMRKEIESQSYDNPYIKSFEIEIRTPVKGKNDKLLNFQQIREELIQQVESTLKSNNLQFLLENYSLSFQLNYFELLYANDTIFNVQSINQTQFNELDLNTNGITILEISNATEDFLLKEFNYNMSSLLMVNESILITKQVQNKLLQNDQIKLFSPWTDEGFVSNASLMVKEVFVSENDQKIDFLQNYQGDLLLVNNLTRQITTFYEDSNLSSYFGYSPYSTRIKIKLVEDISIYDFNQVRTINNALNRAEREIIFGLAEFLEERVYLNDNDCFELDEMQVCYDFSILNIRNRFNLDWILMKIQLLSVQAFFIAMPILILALFLTNYSFNLIFQSLVQKFSIYRMRGMSNRLIFIIQNGELLLLSIIVLVTSMLFAIPVSLIGFQTDEVLNINPGIIPSNFSYNLSNILYFSFITLVLFLALNLIPKIVSISKMSIFPEKNKIEKDSFMIRHNYDLLLIAVSLVVLIGIFLISQIISNPDEFKIYRSLALPFPLILFIGLLFSTSRLLSYGISILSSKFWNNSKLRLALSFKILGSMEKTFKRAFLLITFAIIILTFYSSFPFTSQSIITANYYSTNNHDLIIKNHYETNQNIDLTELKSFITTNYSEELTIRSESIQFRYDPYFDSPSNQGSQDRSYRNDRLLSIDFELEYKSFQEKYSENFFSLKFTSETSLNDLYNTTQDYLPILINDKTLNAFQYTLGDIIDYNPPQGGNLSFKLIGSFDNWPGYYGHFYYFDEQFVGIFDNSQLNSYIPFLNASNLFVKDHELNINYKNIDLNRQVQILSELDEFEELVINDGTRGFNMYSITYDLMRFRNNSENIVLWGELLLFFFFIGLLILITLILYTSYFFSELKTELFTQRALGLSKGQLTNQIQIGLTVLYSTAILYGTLLGSGTLILIQWINDLNADKPSPIAVIPFELLFYFYLILSIIVLASLQLLSRYYNKKSLAGLLNAQ